MNMADGFLEFLIWICYMAGDASEKFPSRLYSIQVY